MVEVVARGTCEHCKVEFDYHLLHNGFNDSAYAYCDQCGRLAILDGWNIPKGIHCRIHQSITKDIEPFLENCECGGAFRADTAPRCPACHHVLSAESAASWIEANAPGTIKGWKWQRNWTGLYAILIGQNFIKDNWKKAPNK